MGRLTEDGDRLHPGVVSSELRRVLTEAPTLTALRSLELPNLDEALRRCRHARADLPNVIAQAIDRLDDQVYRMAGHDLFPFPYADAGWTKLSVRGRKAAERFGISYDGLRKASDSRPSYLDRILGQIAEGLISIVDERAGDSPPPHNAPEEPPPAPVGGSSSGLRPRALSRRVVVGAAVAAVLAGALAWQLSGDTGTHRAATSTEAFLPAGCETHVGQLDVQLAGEPDADQLVTRMVETYRGAAEKRPIGCPTGPAYRWESIAVQELAVDGRGSGALLVPPNGVDLYLNNAAWGSYHQLGGKTGDAAQMTAGLPTRVVPYGDGHVEIELSAGVVLVAHVEDAPYFWIPAVFVPWWRTHQAQVGLPTGNPLPTFRQDFERGFVSVKPPELAVPVLTVVERSRDELPTLDIIRERIIRQTDGTAWFVTEAGGRAWIPDGATWECMGGEAKRVARDLPGYAVATLPFAGQAQCPS